MTKSSGTFGRVEDAGKRARRDRGFHRRNSKESKVSLARKRSKGRGMDVHEGNDPEQGPGGGISKRWRDPRFMQEGKKEAPKSFNAVKESGGEKKEKGKSKNG